VLITRARPVFFCVNDFEERCNDKEARNERNEFCKVGDEDCEAGEFHVFEHPRSPTPGESVCRPPCCSFVLFSLPLMSLKCWLANNREQIHSWTDSVSHIVQVIALVLAGFWTYKTFFESERPSLEAKPDISSDLFWIVAPDPSFCDAGFRVDFLNAGKQSLDTAKVHFEGWLAELPEATGSDPRPIDPQYLEHSGKKFFDQWYQGGPLTQHFPPGSSSHDTVNWRFKRDPKLFVLLRATVDGTALHGYFRREEHFSKQASNWEAVCADIKKETPK